MFQETRSLGLPYGFALLGDVGVPHSGDAVIFIFALRALAPTNHIFHDSEGIRVMFRKVIRETDLLWVGRLADLLMG